MNFFQTKSKYDSYLFFVNGKTKESIAIPYVSLTTLNGKIVVSLPIPKDLGEFNNIANHVGKIVYAVPRGQYDSTASFFQPYKNKLFLIETFQVRLARRMEVILDALDPLDVIEYTNGEPINYK